LTGLGLTGLGLTGLGLTGLDGAQQVKQLSNYLEHFSTPIAQISQYCAETNIVQKHRAKNCQPPTSLDTVTIAGQAVDQKDGR
jgi:hypothetical protein